MRRFVGNLAAAGGTALGDALRTVVLLTDGLPTIGERDPAKIVALASDGWERGLRVFCSGVGRDVNPALLCGISSAGRAHAEIFKPEDQVESRLRSFLDRHPGYAEELGFDAERAFCRKSRAEVEDWTARVRAGIRGIRELLLSVPATSDWRYLGADAREGDLIAFEAKGRWSAGRYAGSCDAAGLSGDRYACHSAIDELRHACLLVRVGGVVLGAERTRGVFRSTAAGRIEARCNDDTYKDDSGEIQLRLLVVPRELLSPRP